jgi:phosphomannomutase
MSHTLMVGVSGVRGIVGQDLTPEFIACWAAAFGTWAAPDPRPRGRRPAVVLARDARTSGPMFAAAAAAGLMSVGCDVIDLGLAPTPTAQLAVEHHRAAGGIILTASHNPIVWNALKFVGPDGNFLDTAAGGRVADLAETGRFPRADFNGIGPVRTDAGALARHLDAVLARAVVGARAVRGRRFRVGLDRVGGVAGAGGRAVGGGGGGGVGAGGGRGWRGAFAWFVFTHTILIFAIKSPRLPSRPAPPPRARAPEDSHSIPPDVC